MQIAVGITNEGELTGIGFLSISDTPGLGMRAKEPDFKDQFIGKKAENLEVTKTGASADNQIEASVVQRSLPRQSPTRQMQLSISWLTAWHSRRWKDYE